MNTLGGFRTLVWLGIRRDRVVLSAWVAVFVVTIMSSAAATIELYPTVESRVQASTTANAASSLVALYGRVYDPTSAGALATLKMAGLGAALVAVVAMLTVVRHTRAEEENGRLELLSSSTVGRYAPLAAALTVSIGCMAVIGVLSAAALAGVGLPLAGSIVFGLSWFAAGAVFATVGAVSAQITRSARAANGISGAVLGVAYLARALGDTAGGGEPGLLSWISPIGWSQQLRPYAGERWSVLLLPAAGALILAGIAFLLVGRRDFGAGLVPDRSGPARGGRVLRSASGLACRLHRNTVLSWAAAFMVLGAVLGNIATNIGGFFSSPGARELITRLGGERSITDSFLAVELGAMGIIASVYAVQAMMRLRTEETAGGADPLLATMVTRVRWMAGHLAAALLGAALILAAGGVAAGVAYGAQVGDIGTQVPRLVGSALVQLPAVLVVTAITVAVLGFVPRAAALGWAALVGFLLLTELGPLFELDQRILDISPFVHIPKLPGAELSLTPLIWLTVIGTLVTVLGFVGFRRRDLA